MSVLAHSWWRYDTSECRGAWLVIPTAAGEGSCDVGVRWRTADGPLTRFSVKEYGRKYLREMERAAVVFDCVGALMAEMRHV